MNLPKQSRPVIRDVTRDPIRARVEPQQLERCLQLCTLRVPAGPARELCKQNCYEVWPINGGAVA